MMVMVVLVVCRCSNDSRMASPFMTCEKEEEEEEQGADECPIPQQCVLCAALAVLLPHRKNGDKRHGHIAKPRRVVAKHHQGKECKGAQQRDDSNHVLQGEHRSR